MALKELLVLVFVTRAPLRIQGFPYRNAEPPRLRLSEEVSAHVIGSNTSTTGAVGKNLRTFPQIAKR